MDPDQAENLERVSLRISNAVTRFCSRHLTFHADDLRRAVIRETGIAAPASADRILRDLRKQGVLDYMVLSRRESFYMVIHVNGKNITANETNDD